MPNTPLDALTPNALERLAALCDIAGAMLAPPLTEADYDALSSLCRAVANADRVLGERQIRHIAREHGVLPSFVVTRNAVSAVIGSTLAHLHPTLAAALGSVGENNG